MKLAELKDLYPTDLAQLDLDDLAFRILGLKIALIEMKQRNADLTIIVDQKYGKIDSAIARDVTLPNDWKRLDRQREWRELDTELQASLTERRGLWDDIDITKAEIDYLQSIRGNRLAHMLCHSTFSDIFPSSRVAELN